ncbi:MAG: NnrU family protein [Gammaproteobacteria bacterium]
MTSLILGLIVFLGMHSVRIFAEDWRGRQIARLGAGGWKGAYSLVSAVGLGLIVYGYGMARAEPVQLWLPPAWTHLFAGVLMLPAMILIVAAYVPANHIRSALGHPMLAGVKIWAFAHLLANGTLGDLLLFGGFLAWAVLDFRAARRRDRVAAVAGAPATALGSVLAAVVGVAAWALFTFYLHGALIGVPLRS